MVGKFLKILQQLFVLAILLSSIVQYHHHVYGGTDSSLCLFHLQEMADECRSDGKKGGDFSDDDCPLHLATVCRLNDAGSNHFDIPQFLPFYTVLADDSPLEIDRRFYGTVDYRRFSLYTQGKFSFNSLRDPPVTA